MNHIVKQWNKSNFIICPQDFFIYLDPLELHISSNHYGLPWWLSGKESVCNGEDPASIPGLGKSPGEGNGNPLQYSCLENPMDRGAQQAIEET